MCNNCANNSIAQVTTCLQRACVSLHNILCCISIAYTALDDKIRSGPGFVAHLAFDPSKQQTYTVCIHMQENTYHCDS